MLSDAGFTALIPISEVAPDVMDRIASFSCGKSISKSSLNDFLHCQSLLFHTDNLSRTSLIFHEDFSSLVGYITLTNDSIPLNISEVGELGIPYEIELNSFPAVKICRLAVHEDLQRQGIGKRILDLTTGELVGTPTVTVARLLITDAVNDPEVIGFYRKLGFEESFWAIDQAKHHSGKSKERATIKMIRDIYA